MAGPCRRSGLRQGSLRRLFLAVLVLLPIRVAAQEETPSEILAQSNNPLAPLSGINFNEYYAPNLYDAPGVANTFNIQGVLIPLRRHFDLFHIVRVTLPVATVPADSGVSESGLGDLVIQDAFRVSRMSAQHAVRCWPAARAADRHLHLARRGEMAGRRGRRDRLCIAGRQRDRRAGDMADLLRG